MAVPCEASDESKLTFGAYRVGFDLRNRHQGKACVSDKTSPLCALA